MSRNPTNRPAMRTLSSRITQLALTPILVVSSFAPVALAGGGTRGG
jgi:hypothetical protein